jgi:hypothetical protein
MAGVLVGMVLCWGIAGLLTFSLEAYRKFVTARADGRSGIAPFTVYFLCGTLGLWVLGTIVYFGLARM